MKFVEGAAKLKNQEVIAETSKESIAGVLREVGDDFIEVTPTPTKSIFIPLAQLIALKEK